MRRLLFSRSGAFAIVMILEGEALSSVSKKDLLEDVFDKFLRASGIFREREVLRPDYVPSHLPHREEQLKRLAEILAPVLKGSRCSNVFIYGQTGTGKTAVIRHVLDRLIHKGHESGAPLEACYVNCRLAGTDYRVLSRMCEALGLEIPFTGLAVGEVFDRFKAALDAQESLLLIVLDEIDALIKMRGDTLLYELTRINESLKHGRVVLIGISNDLHFKELLDPRVLSSLGEEEVVFRPYTAPELRDILFERAKLAFSDGVLTDGVINLCAAVAAAEHGDARRALDLLRVAGELAEREGDTKVTDDHVRRAREKIEQDRVVEVLKTLPLHSKLVLCGIYLMKQAEINESITGDVFAVYNELCEHLGIDPLTQRRVSGLINELDVIGVLNTRVVSLGRYGRTKRVRLGVPRSVIKAVFTDDNWVGRLLTYVPKCLRRNGTS
jgi:cell division control protein 6